MAKDHFVEFNGKPVKSVKNAFLTVVELAKIDLMAGSVTPHSLRHTAATWLRQHSTDLWTAAAYLGMTTETLENVYGHHYPDYLTAAVEDITTKAAKRRARDLLDRQIGLVHRWRPRKGSKVTLPTTTPCVGPGSGQSGIARVGRA